MSFSPIQSIVTGKEAIKTVRMEVINSTLPYGIDGEDFECVVSVNHVLRNTITKNPVQFGAPVGDNIVKEAVEITLSGVLNPNYSSPLGLVDASISIPGLDSATNNTTVWYEYFKEIYELKNGGKIKVTIYPQSYENMIVENLSFKDSAKAGLGLEYVMKLVQMISPEDSVLNPRQSINATSPEFYDTVTGAKNSLTEGFNPADLIVSPGV